MSSNQLEAATCAALSHVLPASCCLENLWLDGNPLGKQVSSAADPLPTPHYTPFRGRDAIGLSRASHIPRLPTYIFSFLLSQLY